MVNPTKPFRTSKKDIFELEKYTTIKRWLRAVMAEKTNSERTKYCYLECMHEFVRWIGKNPDELIAERKIQLKSDEEDVRRQAEEKLLEFMEYLEKDRKLARNTAKKYHAAIRSFYKYNYLPLQVKTPKSKTLNTGKPATPEQIRRICEFASIRDKAIILFMAQSGISIGDLLRLKYGDVREDLEKGVIPVHVSLIREKEDIRYETFIGTEAVEALKKYLELRRQGTKDIPPEELTDDSPLFRAESVEIRPVAKSTLTHMMQKLNKLAGTNITFHSLRKFFETHLILAGASELLVKYWMGHSLGIENHYFIPPVEKQREAYKKFESSLSIGIGATTEVEVLRERVKMLEAKLQEYKERLNGLTEEYKKEFKEHMKTKEILYSKKEMDRYIEERAKEIFKEMLKTLTVEDLEQILKRKKQT